MLLETISSLTKEAIFVTVIASMPAILASLTIGLLVAIFSATTQIHEQTLSFAPKMVAVYLALIAFGTFVYGLLIDFGRTCFAQMLKL